MAKLGLKDSPARQRGIVDHFTEWSLNWVPDSMVFVTVLTVIVYLMAVTLTKHGPLEVLDDYAKGFWVLLTFSMQLSLMMITGFVVANSKLVNSGLIKLIDLPKGAKSTLVMFCLVVGFTSWLHWAIGIMTAIVMGKEIAVRKRGLGIHYPLLAGAAYGMNNIGANGISQTAPLLAATQGSFIQNIIGDVIPLTQTALSPFLMSLVFFQLLTLPLLFLLLMPKKENVVEIDDATYNEFSQKQAASSNEEDLRPAEKWERSKVLLSLIGAAILIWVGRFLVLNGTGKIDLNIINFTFLGLGMILHGSPHRFIASVKSGVGTTYGVLIQFPFYAGIFGIITNSGLANVITHWFISISTPANYSWLVLVYTAIMDFFVPSGGSKFAIEAPYIIPAGQQLGIPVSHIINAYSSGGQLANNIQPFWALAFLAAFKLRFQDILPYTFAVFAYVGTLVTIALFMFPKGL